MTFIFKNALGVCSCHLGMLFLGTLGAMLTNPGLVHYVLDTNINGN